MKLEKIYKTRQGLAILMLNFNKQKRPNGSARNQNVKIVLYRARQGLAIYVILIILI